MTPADPRTVSARQGSAARIAQIIAAAEAILVESGGLPLSIKEVGEAVGASRALVYTYFPDGAALAEAVLAEQFAALARAGIEGAATSGMLTVRAEACAQVYVRHVAKRGPLIHIILRDRDQLALAPEALRLQRRVMRGLAGCARTTLDLSPREALALFELLLVIAEEAGRLVFRGQLSLDDALFTSARLIRSGIDAIRPNGLGPA